MEARLLRFGQGTDFPSASRLCIDRQYSHQMPGSDSDRRSHSPKKLLSDARDGTTLVAPGAVSY